MENNNYGKEAVAFVEEEMKNRNYLKTVERLFKEGKNHEMQVIQHYDARSNNILFNYAAENTTPMKATLVDFQFSSFFPPFWDLVYFLALSVSSDNLIPNYHSLIKRFDNPSVPCLLTLELSQVPSIIGINAEEVELLQAYPHHNLRISQHHAFCSYGLPSYRWWH